MKLLLHIFFLISAVCSQALAQTDHVYVPLEYGLYFGGNKAGYFEGVQLENGSFQYVFDYNDRGRGPHLTELIKLNENRLPQRLSINGHNYLKDTVSEVFILQNGIASWNSTSENGSSPEVGEAFYVGVDGTFGETELLVRKMLGTVDHSVSLYPSGKLSITEVDDITIEDTLDLKLIELVGYSFSPFYLWFDQNNRLFAAPSTWLSLIRNGYEEFTEQLLLIQTEKEKRYYTKTASELTETPSGRVVISHVNIFNVESGMLDRDRHVVIHGNLIEDILAGNEALPDDAELIDGRGKTLLPGLFDMHTHLDRSQGILNLAAGVTSVRDLANSFDLPEIRDEFNENTVLGPRILIMSGFIDQAGPYAGPIGKIISSLQEGLDAIGFYKERGYDQIKLYSSIDPAWVRPLAQKAHRLGLRVCGHIPAHMLAAEAVADGYDEIQHINMIALNFMSDTIDTRTPLRFSMIGEEAHTIDVHDTAFISFVNLLKNKNIVVDPTVSIFEGMLTTKPGEPDPQFAAILDRLPIQIKRAFFTGGLPIAEGKEWQYKKSFDKLLEMIKALYDSGVVIVPGTDAMPGFSLHKELENYVRAGIPPEEVLKMATIISARVTGHEDDLGSIEKGKLADVILVDGDPVQNISDIRRVELTIKDGNLYRSKDLYEAIGVKHFK
ncbi:MAG: amidohydrolase family protein [Saprospiraceae bacterium]|nr:amidohydrolase family protein [Saprospiraceae bacterium]